MAFNFSAGLSAAGAAISQTAGIFAAENIRAELEREKITLADMLASKREETQRQFQAGEADKTRTHQSGEAEKDRTFKGEEGRLDRENRLATTRMSAGASIESARISASSVDKQITAREKEAQRDRDAAIEAATKIQIGDDGTAYAVNPVSKKVEPLKVDGEPLKFRDPDVAKAQIELIKTKSVQLNDITRSYLPQIKSLEDTIRKLQTDPLTKADPAGQKELARTQAELKALQERFEAEKAPIMHELNEYARFFASKGKVSTAPAGGGGRPPLSDLIKIPGVTPPAGGPGLINQPQ